jgi:hypothetical protein
MKEIKRETKAKLERSGIVCGAFLVGTAAYYDLVYNAYDQIDEMNISDGAKLAAKLGAWAAYTVPYMLAEFKSRDAIYRHYEPIIAEAREMDEFWDSLDTETE